MVTIKCYHDEKPQHTKNDDSENDLVCDPLCDGTSTQRPEQQSAQQGESCRKIQAHDPIWLSINAEPAHRALNLTRIRLHLQCISASIEGIIPEKAADWQANVPDFDFTASLFG